MNPQPRCLVTFQRGCWTVLDISTRPHGVSAVLGSAGHQHTPSADAGQCWTSAHVFSTPHGPLTYCVFPRCCPLTLSGRSNCSPNGDPGRPTLRGGCAVTLHAQRCLSAPELSASSGRARCLSASARCPWECWISARPSTVGSRSSCSRPHSPRCYLSAPRGGAKFSIGVGPPGCCPQS